MSAAAMDRDPPAMDDARPAPPVEGQPRPPRAPRTALAFMVAPAPAAALGAGLVAVAALGGGLPAAAIYGAAVFVGAALCGYLSALVLGVPINLLIPRRRRVSPFATILLGGVTAAAPWTAGALLSRDGTSLLVAGIAFDLGGLGGFAFWTMRRRWPRWLPRPIIVRGEEGRGRERGGEQT